MSIDTALQRVATINQALTNPAALVAKTGGAAAPEAAASPSSASTANTFAATLASASTDSGQGGSRIVAAAESQIGQTEQPPGSNESPAIAEYRGATAGAAPGEPWCAYFASWAARQAGEPLGPQGEGLGSVSAIWSWAQNSGRAVANGPGVVPKPGDLIVFGGEHVGIVKGVLPDGSIQTVEGNYENKVSLNVRPAGEASGYVSMS
jgi:CHAP domain